MRSVPEQAGPITLGVDLRSGPRYPTGLAVMDAARRLHRLALVRTDAEILEAVDQFAPACVAIDAPLGLPEGRCCADRDCACAAYGIMREVDRACAAAGFRPFPTLLPSMVQLTLRGIALHAALERRERHVIEVYPGMAQDVLAIPRKRAGLPLLRRGLKRHGVLGLPRGRRVHHDELDAVTCAFVAQLHLAGETETMGPGIPVPLVLPRRDTGAYERASEPAHEHAGKPPRERGLTIPAMASDDQIRELLEKMREERAALVAVVSTLDDAAAEYRPPEGDGEAAWSPKEQLSHLAGMETAYRAWVERALAEDRPDVTSDTHPDPIAYPMERAHEASVAEHLAELARQRARTLELISGLAPEQYERTARNANFGELTVLQWLRSYYRHDRMHAAQMQGRQSDYRPRFLRGEPDQRRRS